MRKTLDGGEWQHNNQGMLIIITALKGAIRDCLQSPHYQDCLQSPHYQDCLQSPHYQDCLQSPHY